jgi:hypothetical protein
MPDVNIGAELQSLPLGFLLGAPMKAAIEAQALAAQTTTDFHTNALITTDPTTGQPAAVMVTFTFQQTLPDPTDPTSVITQDVALSVPLLSITQVPYLRINDLTVDFEFKIRDVQSVSNSLKLASSTSTTSTSTTKFETASGGGLLSFLGFGKTSGEFQNDFKLTFNASVTYQRTDRQQTDRSATFKMHLNAVQDPIPEGMQRVLQILSDTIKAIAATALPPPPPPPP